MKIGTMQFRDYVFRSNPESIRLEEGSVITQRLCPGKGFIVDEWGKKPRTIVCVGSFYGPTSHDALSQAAQFRQSAAENQAGLLFLPGFEPVYAHLAEFRLDAVGDGRILPYTMKFVEQPDSNKAGGGGSWLS